MARADPGLPRKESLIAADITIEGKIEGGGSVRIAGKFKGDASVQGDLTIEAGAKLTGSVRADKVTIAGELEGNVEEASHIDLQPTGVVIGDLKAGSLTVAAGARMRGQAEFGWDDGKGLESRQARQRARRGERHRLMSSVRPGSPGATRECPHCRETDPRKRSPCVRPAGITCDSTPAPMRPRRPRSRRCASKAASGIPADGEPWEYTVVVSIRNDRGVEIARKLIGVGAMNPNEQRTFTLSVEAVSATAKGHGKDGTRH